MADSEEFETSGLEQDETVEASEDDKNSGAKLPITRIKKIMKFDPELNLTSQEAVFLIAKATELFIESMTLEAYKFTLQHRKKTIAKKDVDSAINAIDALAFLDGALDS